MPVSASHNKAERISAWSGPAVSIRSACSSVTMSPAATITSPVPISKRSSAITRPKIRSYKESTTSLPLITARTVKPLDVPQSSILTIQSCATSTSRRVRYPELAVFSAVSARPLRAPWVELKYSRTFRPSLNDEMIGVSIISPDGLAISPRIPASCLICAAEPRAPECAIIQTELIGSPSRIVEIPFIISSATKSEQRDHTSTTLLYFSPWVIRPSRYCCSKVLTCASASETYFSFKSGVVRSAIPNEIPASHACPKPSVMRRSQKITVSFWPQ